MWLTNESLCAWGLQRRMRTLGRLLLWPVSLQSLSRKQFWINFPVSRCTMIELDSEIKPASRANNPLFRELQKSLLLLVHIRHSYWAMVTPDSCYSFIFPLHYSLSLLHPSLSFFLSFCICLCLYLSFYFTLSLSVSLSRSFQLKNMTALARKFKRREHIFGNWHGKDSKVGLKHSLLNIFEHNFRSPGICEEMKMIRPQILLVSLEEDVQHAFRLVSSPYIRTLRLFLLPQQKEERSCSETAGKHMHLLAALTEELRVLIFVLTKKGSKTKKRMKNEEIQEGECGPQEP